MNFFSMLNQVEQAAAVNNNNAKTQALNIPEVEPQPEPEVNEPKKTKKQKPSEGAGAENIEQPEHAPTESEEEE